ncbi:MAG: heme ABC exporter ATP-binding protein CcmA [Wenzhouxiangella sp.]
MSALLQASRVTFQRQGEDVFEAADLTLNAGQATVILGPNGSGKTTLLRLLAGILKPASGTLERSARTAFLGHLPALKGELTCRENLDFLARFHGAGTLNSSKALARVGLAGLGLRPARALSAGQKRRLGLAGLLVSPRPIWLLDEPYASLDNAGCRLVDTLLEGHLADGGTVALSTHQHKPQLAQGFQTLQVSPARRAEVA